MNRRMKKFTDEVLEFIDTEEFLKLPQSAQVLYFNLYAWSDDNNFLKNPKAIQRHVNRSDEDMEILIKNKMVIMAADGAYVSVGLI